MPVPVLVSSTPSDGAVSISPEIVIVLTFNTNIDSTSVNSGTVVLYRGSYYDPVYCMLAVSDNTIRMTPTNALMDNEAYRVSVIGDASNPAGVVESTSGHSFAATQDIGFRTGKDRFVSLDEVVDRTDIATVGPIRATSDLAAQPATGSLELVSITPDRYAYDVPVGTDEIVLEFNQDIDPTTIAAGIVVTQKNVFYMDNMYAEDEDADGVVDFDPDESDNTPPTGTLSGSGSQVTWTRQASQSFLHNTLVQIVVNSSLKSLAGASLLENYRSYFLTDVYPIFGGIGLIRLEMGLSVASINDATIELLLHKNSIDVWENQGRDFELESPMHAHYKWVRCKTILDIINVLTLATQLGQGSTKTLGDFSMQVRPTNPELQFKWRDANDCLSAAQRLLDSGVIARYAVKGVNSPTAKGSFRYRTWDRFYLRKTPIVGTAEDRKEILELDFDYSVRDKPADSQNRYS